MKRYLEQGYLILNSANSLEKLLEISNENIDIESDKLKSVEEMKKSFVVIEEGNVFYRLG